MSVLNFPRIYLNGHMSWNPPTANNNDVLPLYDAVRMKLNWPFLAYYKITPENAPQQLMPWIVAPLANAPDYVAEVPTNASQLPMIPAEWNLFGDNACSTVNYQQTKSVVIGGELQASNYIDADALVNKSFQLLGNPFGSPAPTPARFVDVSPWQNTFTALFFDKLVVGDDNCGLTLNRQYRMLDRFLNFNWAQLGGLNYVTTTWQTCFPTANLQWALGDSVLLKNLQQQIQQQHAQGLMFRFSTYLTFYDRNGVFNDYPYVNTRSHDKKALETLQGMYQRGLDNVADIFFNPAYSRTAGTLGLWFANEFPTAPGGRRLVPKVPLPIYKEKPGDTKDRKGNNMNITLGVISAEVNNNMLSLDLANTFPFYPINNTASIPVAEKFHAGDFAVCVNNQGTPITLATFGFDQYNQAAFDKRSGILDLPLSPSAANSLTTGSLELQLKGESITAATQQMWTAEVVESAGFIDVGDTKTLTIMVQYNGLPAPAGTVLWVAEYANPFMVTNSNYYLAFDNDADFTLFYRNLSDNTKNQANLPQFEGAPSQPNTLAVGSGRTLSSLTETAALDITVPVRYQAYQGTPTAVSLKSCLRFANAIQASGQLKDDSAGNIQYQLTQIQTDAQGIAKLTISAIAPGFPTLRFFVQEDNQQPTIPFSFNYTTAYTDFLAPLRVLPQEPQLELDFVHYWNTIYRLEDARILIWENFIFPKILQPFYYLYPIMNKYMPLNSLQRIEGAIDQLIVLVSKDYQEESTLAMPITRDLPQSRRAVLEVWANALVKRNYPPMTLSASDFSQ